MASLIRLINGMSGFVVGMLTPGASAVVVDEPDVLREWEDGTARNQEDGTRRSTE